MPGKSFADLCIKCKGSRRLCGLGKCPILERVRSHMYIYKNIQSERFDGATPPSLLVGEYGYPKVRVMLNIPPNIHGYKAKIYDSPLDWWGKYNLDMIIKLRSSMIASSTKVNVNDPWKLYEKEINLASVSKEPVDSEVILKDRPIPKIQFNGLTKPIALRGDVDKIRITSNPRLGSLLEKRIFDDAKALDSVIELYEAGYDIYTIIHALSGGLLGRIRNRRIVPTRWAITAVDSMLGNYYRRFINEYDYIDSTYVFKGEYLGNRFIVILFPNVLELEWIEAWHGRGLWSPYTTRVSFFRVNEDPLGRWNYMDGGYIAARLPVLEYLHRIRRQAGVLIYREILPSYYAPVGNWHIRETVRNILKTTPNRYDSIKEAVVTELNYFSIPTKYWIENSLILRRESRQRRLIDYMRR